MMKFFEKTKGSVSVFLILVMVPLYTCAYLAIEAAAYSDSISKTGGALNLAGNTALSSYDTTLKELYGIMAMSECEGSLQKRLSDDYAEMTGIDGNLYTNFIEEKSLRYSDTLEYQIQNSMKYTAPYNWARSVIQKMSIFTEASTLMKVFEKSSDYYKALSSADDAAKRIYECIGAVNVSSDKLESQLQNILSVIPSLRKELKNSSKKADSYKQEVGCIENSEIKALLESDLSSILLDENAISDFEKSLKSDIERIKQKEEPITIEDLSFTESPFYEYITTYCGKKGSDGDASLKDSLETISGTDLSSLIKTISNVKVSELISDYIYESLIAGTNESKESISISEKISADAKNSYLVEFISSKFNCMTYPLNNAALPGEQEYIIFGRDNTNLNFTLCVDLIFSVRVLLNTVYVFTNSQMRQTALSVAAAMAGATGLGVTIAKNLVMLTWAAAESVLDVASLCKGDTVPIYKTASTWTLSLNNIPSILAGGVSEYACKSIDDIFEELEDISGDKVSEFKNAALSYADRTAESAVNILADTVITPITNKIASITAGVKTNYTQAELCDMFSTAVDSIDSQSEGVKMAKEYFKKYCLPALSQKAAENINEVFSGDETIAEAARQALEGAASDAYKALSAGISIEAGKYEEKFVSSLNKTLEGTKERVKDRVSSELSEYADTLSGFVEGTEANSYKGLMKSGFISSAGFCMSYEDYLKVFMLIGLANQKTKNNMLHRCAVVMQINCGKKAPEFDITKCYTQISIGVNGKLGAYSFSKEGLFAY